MKVESQENYVNSINYRGICIRLNDMENVKQKSQDKNHKLKS